MSVAIGAGPRVVRPLMGARRSWTGLWGRPKAALGGCILLAFVAAAVLAPLLTPHSPTRSDPLAFSQPPDARHLLGTDDLGRDVLARILYGGRYTLGLSILSAVAAAGLGLVAGVWSGYAGGVADALIMRVTDVLLAFPVFLLALALMAAVGPALFNIVAVLAAARAPRYARLMRAVVLQQKALDYVTAARATGAGDARIVTRHVLPNCLSSGLIYATFDAGTMLTALAGLSFLGVGVQPPAPDWGLMLTDARQYIYSSPWAAVFPGMAITLCVMAVNFLGDGLRDWLDPRMRQ